MKPLSIGLLILLLAATAQAATIPSTSLTLNTIAANIGNWSNDKNNYYLLTNPLGFYNITTLPDFYPKLTNPLGYYNSTTFTNYYPLLSNPLGYYNTSSLPYQSNAAGWANNTTTIVTNLNVIFNGNITLNNTAFDDEKIPLLSVAAGGVKPAVEKKFVNNTYAFMFENVAANNEEELYGSLQMSHSYKLNSTIECHLHWSPTTTNVGNVSWQLESTYADIGSVFPTTNINNCTGTTNGTAYAHYLCDFHNTARFNLISGILMLRVVRRSGLATDTYTGDAAGLSLDCHYEKDTLGSDAEYAK